MLGALIQVMAGTGRIERLSHGLCQSNDIDAALKEIVPFVSGGLRALEHVAASERPLAEHEPAKIGS